MFLSAAGFVALGAVLYKNTVYVSLRCRVCGTWCGSVQQYCLCFFPLQGLWRLVRFCTTILFMFLSAAGFVVLTTIAFMFLSTGGFVTLGAVLYNKTVYVSLRCRFCGAWCGTIQQDSLCFSPLQGLWRLVRYCTTILFMFLSAAGFVALGVVLYNRLGQFVSKI